MRDCHDSPMKTYLTLSSQLAAMDFLFITVIPKSYLSLYKKKKKGSSSFLFSGLAYDFIAAVPNDNSLLLPNKPIFASNRTAFDLEG